MPSAAREAAAAAPAAGDVLDYLALAKPRVMSLVVFTGVVGMMLAPGAMHPVLAAASLLALALGGGAGAINMWADRDIDAVMDRTRERPLPRGRVPAAEALGFGIALSLLSVLLMGLASNWMAALLLASSSLFYVFVYTLWLKRRTPQNIVVGAPPALPPVIAWASVTGGVDALPLLLFAIVFLWTPPHFWALALVRADDYRRAGVPMMPLTHGDAATRRAILVYSAVVAAFALAPWALGELGAVYGAGAAVLGVLLTLAAAAVSRRREGSETRLFAFSIAYLFLLFLLMPLDRLLSGAL